MVHSTAKKRGKRPDKKARGSGSFKGRRTAAPKEVVFDDDARREYLTGFSKRKQEKKTAARQKAINREKEEAKELRQQLRNARKQQVADNVQTANEFYGGAMKAAHLDSENDEDDGVYADPQEQEYANEEMTSRVVIEEFDPNNEDDGFAPSNNRWPARPARSAEEDIEEEQEDMDEDGDLDMDGPNANIFSILPSSKPKAKIAPAQTRRPKRDEFATPNDTPQKQPAKRFTYETKAARRLESAKQKARRSEKADSARSRSSSKGGKSSSSKKGGKKR